MWLHSGHITAWYSGHDSDILLVHRRLGPRSDLEKTARIIHCAQRTLHRFASFPNFSCDLSFDLSFDLFFSHFFRVCSTFPFDLSFRLFLSTYPCDLSFRPILSTYPFDLSFRTLLRTLFFELSFELSIDFSIRFQSRRALHLSHVVLHSVTDFVPSHSVVFR